MLSTAKLDFVSRKFESAEKLYQSVIDKNRKPNQDAFVGLSMIKYIKVFVP